MKLMVEPVSESCQSLKVWGESCWAEGKIPVETPKMKSPCSIKVREEVKVVEFMSSTVLDFISLLNYVIVDWCSVLKMWFFFTAMTSSGGQPWIVDIPERMSWPTCESTVAARGHPGRMRSSGRLRAKDRTNVRVPDHVFVVPIFLHLDPDPEGKP